MKMQKLMGALILILMLGATPVTAQKYERLSSIGICQRGD